MNDFVKIPVSLIGSSVPFACIILLPALGSIGSNPFSGTVFAEGTIGIGVEEMVLTAFARCTTPITSVMNAGSSSTLNVLDDDRKTQMPQFQLSVARVKVSAGCCSTCRNAVGWNGSIYNFTFEEVIP